MARSDDQEHDEAGRSRADAAKSGPIEADTTSPSEGLGWHRLGALGIAAIVLFPLLGKSGIWDPYELDTADLARRIAIRSFGAASLELPNALNSLPTLTDLKTGELGFTSMALGFKLLGLRDWSGRLPLAVWGLVGVLALYEFLARLVDKRAGLYSAIALVTMPLYFMQARTMLGDIVTMSALAMAFSGLGGAMLDDRAPGLSRARLAWFALGVVGLAAGFMSRGFLIGVATPALGVGLAWVALRGSDERRGVGPRDLFGGLALGIGAAALGYGMYVLAHASPEAPMSRALGFVVLRRAPNEATFDLIVRQLGHALFPWSAFLPFALGRLLRAPVEAPEAARERETGVRVALLTSAAVAYGAFALIAPRAGALPFTGTALLAAVAALAVLDFERGAPASRAAALGCLVLGAVLCADILHEPTLSLSPFVVDRPQFPKSFEEAASKRTALMLLLFGGVTALTWFESTPKPGTEPNGFRAWTSRRTDQYFEVGGEFSRVWNGNLLFGLVVIEAALVGLGAMIFVGRRVGWAPVDKLPKNFADVGLNAWWALPLLLATAPALLIGIRDGFRAVVSVSRMPRASFTLIAALLAGGAQSFWYYPALAAQLSPKEAFESYAALRKPGEPLALLGVRSRAAAYYAGAEVESFTDPNKAYSWLMEKTNERRWMLLKADDLPRVNALYRGQMGKNLPILDGRSSQILLASNQLGDHPNQNWLSQMVLDEPPHPARQVDAQFEDQLEAIGWDVTDKAGAVVESVVPATKYHLRTYYRALRPIAGTWKAFVHIDGSQRRFNGDHPVLDGKYPMGLWRAGDVILDDLEFQLEPNFTPGDYTVYFGFFSGETRFKVTRGREHENRVIAGSLTVR